MGPTLHRAARLHHQTTAREDGLRQQLLLTDQLLCGIDVRTGADFFADRDHWQQQARRIVFTGAIDQFFDYRFGRLDYRTVRFETETLDTPNYQGNAVVNYTEAHVPYTRIIEHKHFETFGTAVDQNPQTVISREYPAEYREGMEPFYPINDDRNTRIAEQYRQLAADAPVIFGGRLAEYRYYDMDKVILSALEKAQDELKV